MRDLDVRRKHLHGYGSSSKNSKRQRSPPPLTQKIAPQQRNSEVSQTDSKDIIHNNPSIHGLCTIGRIGRKLHNTDVNCFYWSMIIALDRFQGRYSYEQIETIRPSYALKEILRLRIEIFNWWNAQMQIDKIRRKVYAPERNYMVNMPTYVILETMPTCMNIAADRNVDAPHIKFIIDTLHLKDSIASRIYLVHQISKLMNITLPTEVFSNKDQDEFKCGEQAVKYYECLMSWHAKWPASVRNKTNRLLIDEVEDDMLKGIISKFIYHAIQNQFYTLPERTLDDKLVEFRFYKEEFHSILDMDAGTCNDEYIAIAAIHKVVIFCLSYTETELLERELQELIRLNDPKCIKAFGLSHDDPFETRMVKWSEARPYLLKNRAIATGKIVTDGVAHHVSPVSTICPPIYVTNEQLRDIEENGRYFLRSLCNAANYGKDVPAFLYALMLACAPMPRGFRYCCTILHETYVEKWLNHIASQYLQWWKNPSSVVKIELIIRLHTTSALPTFVYSTRTPNANDIVIDTQSRIYIDTQKLDAITMPELCQKWVNAVVFAHILGKTIFVVRGTANITAYSESEIRYNATWEDVMSSLRKKEGVCFFTRESTDENDFDVTHVVLPASPESTHAHNNTANASSSSSSDAMTYTGSTSIPQWCGCASARPLQSCTWKVLTLEEADALMQTLPN